MEGGYTVGSMCARYSAQGKHAYTLEILDMIKPTTLYTLVPRLFLERKNSGLRWD